MLQDMYDRLAATSGRPSKLRNKRSGLTIVDSVASSKGQDTGGFWSGINTLMMGKGDEDGAGNGTAQAHTEGLYMYGGVGCGKTMLMDLFVESAPSEMKVKRTHFHDFMLDVHTKLRSFKDSRDPLLRVADTIAKEVRVLAMDEFFVTDVADAMILHRLFGRLWDRDVVLVSTSNRAPDKLYEGGLQRSLFMPFIDRLKVECKAHDMESKTDYRKLAHSQRGLYFTSPTRDDELRRDFQAIAESSTGKEPAQESIQVAMGRHIDVLAAGKSCLFTFLELCGRPVGASDFIALAEHYNTVALSGVPIFNASNMPAAYRFVTLIDVLYDHRVRVLVAAEGMPADLFQYILTQVDAASSPGAKEDPRTTVDDNLGFAKDRTVSRLMEMQSLEYLVAFAEKHVPESVLALKERSSSKKFWLHAHRNPSS